MVPSAAMMLPSVAIMLPSGAVIIVPSSEVRRDWTLEGGRLLVTLFSTGVGAGSIVLVTSEPSGSIRGVPSSVVRILPSAGLMRWPAALVTIPSGRERTRPSEVV